MWNQAHGSKPGRFSASIMSRPITRTLLQGIKRHLEDLDNRRSRRNICIRRLPEAVEQHQLERAVLEFFNSLLDRAPDSPIILERMHRALRPQPNVNEPSRDVVFCLADFRLKEEIMRRERDKDRLDYYRTELQLYQDLSAYTLPQWRALRPLLNILRSKGVVY